MKPDDQPVLRDGAQINGQTDGPRGSDDTNPDDRAQDNLNTDLQQDSANGLDSETIRGGQDGRNNRGMGSQDMDSKNGVLRMGDMDNSTMEVTEQAVTDAAASESKTSTSTVSVTTAGPDDYASDPEVKTPNAQKEAKASSEASNEGDEEETSQEKEDSDIAKTGTSLDNQPTY